MRVKVGWLVGRPVFLSINQSANQSVLVSSFLGTSDWILVLALNNRNLTYLEVSFLMRRRFCRLLRILLLPRTHLCTDLQINTIHVTSGLPNFKTQKPTLYLQYLLPGRVINMYMYIYCTLLAVLVRFTEHTTQLVTLVYIADSTSRYYNPSLHWVLTPDVSSRGGLLRSSPSKGWQLTDCFATGWLFAY
jgi:hypothetical protein